MSADKLTPEELAEIQISGTDAEDLGHLMAHIRALEAELAAKDAALAAAGDIIRALTKGADWSFFNPYLKDSAATWMERNQ